MLWLLLLSVLALPTYELGVPWRAPAVTSRALQRELSEVPCLTQAAEILFERRDEANEVNVCALLYRLSGSRDVHSSSLRRMLEAASEVAPQMKSRQLANTARALALCAKREKFATKTAILVLDRIYEDSMSWFRPEEIGMASWAAARFVELSGEEDDDVRESARRALAALGERASQVIDVYAAQKEAANVGWALAKASVKSDSEREAARNFLVSVAAARDKSRHRSKPTPRDVSTLAWACAKLGDADWRLAEESRAALEATLSWVRHDRTEFFENAMTRDVSQLASALATAAYDSPELFDSIHEFVAANYKDRTMQLGDASAVLRASAVLDRPPPVDVFAILLRPVSKITKSFELSILVWAAAVLSYAGEDYAALAADALRRADLDRLRTPEDLRRLHQALLALQVELDEDDFQKVQEAVDPKIRDKARENWSQSHDLSTTSDRASSARHRSVADTLHALKAQHKVVATVRDEYGDLYVDMLVKIPNRKALVALEFDGPSHFCSNDPRRPLGHTCLKRRLLAARGFDVISIPYLDWDAIPYWSTMERQRFVQRKLKITETLRYQGGDLSYYSEMPEEARKVSRLD